MTNLPVRLLGPLLLAFLTTLLVACSEPGHDSIRYYTVQTQKPYDDVIAELKLAISDKNFRITAHSRVGHVIATRKQQPFPEYDTIQFCNLTLAEEMLQIQPQAIRHMPCNVVTYLSGKPEQTTVQVRLLPTDGDDPAMNDFASRMNQTLRQIVDFAVET